MFCIKSKPLDFIFFADDINIFFSHKNINIFEKMLNEELIKLNDWCRVDKLSINYKKSNFILFQPRQKRKTLKVNLKIDQTTIERVKETMFLGVIIDEALSWKSHITNIARKISKSMGIIYRASIYLPISSFCTFIRTLFTLFFMGIDMRILLKKNSLITEESPYIFFVHAT